MKRIEQYQKIQTVLYSYDNEDEWKDDYKRMLEYGWSCGGKSYTDDSGKYYQKYSRLIDY